MVNLGGTQKVDFLGTCFGGAGLGLNSWAMISLMGTRVQHHGVHARDDVRWETWEVPALVVMGWVTGRNRSIQHKSGRRYVWHLNVP